MIDLWRREHRPLRIGHRGAAALASENTVRSFRAAVAAGVDLIEFDVLDLPRGPLVVAHSNHLDEVSHGVARGRVRDLSLDAFARWPPSSRPSTTRSRSSSTKRPASACHVDLKLRTRLDELAAAIVRHGLEARTVVSGVHVESLQAVARAAPGVRVGMTYPEDKLSISRRPYLWPIVSLGLHLAAGLGSFRLPRLARRAGASAVMLQHRLVTEIVGGRAHAAGLPVLAWTVDEPAELERVVAAGVDGVITNDPRIFVATLKR